MFTDELRILCERKFNVQIDDADFVRESFCTVRRVAMLIQRLLRDVQVLSLVVNALRTRGAARLRGSTSS